MSKLHWKLYNLKVFFCNSGCVWCAVMQNINAMFPSLSLLVIKTCTLQQPPVHCLHKIKGQIQHSFVILLQRDLQKAFMQLCIVLAGIPSISQ